MLVFVVLYNRKSILFFSKTVIKSFGVCLQINCVVTKDPGTHCFLNRDLMALDWTHDFSQDKSQDSPQLFVTKSLLGRVGFHKDFWHHY